MQYGALSSLHNFTVSRSSPAYSWAANVRVQFNEHIAWKSVPSAFDKTQRKDSDQINSGISADLNSTSWLLTSALCARLL